MAAIIRPMTPERVQVVIIGGGVIGCAILYELARRGIVGLLVEAEPDLCEGTSKANSAILHTGFDAKPGTIEARMLRRAAELWPDRIDELGVPFLAVGAIMIARTEEEAGRLSTEIARNATVLGVPTHLLDRASVRELAPYLAEDVAAALSIPDEGVLDPFWLTRAFAEAAISIGAEARLNRAVVGLEVGDDGVRVRLSDDSVIAAAQVIDAAGLRADEVANLSGDRSFVISPRKGQFIVSEETFGVDRIVLPVPSALGKGMLVTPIVFGGLLLGPTAVDGTDKGDRATDPSEQERILTACRAMVPALAKVAPIRQFAGLRHVSSTGDFILRPSSTGDRLYVVAGIRSTGISTAPAVAEAVVDDVIARRGWNGAPPPRVLRAPAIELPEQPGEIVCLCRSIGRGEVEAACRHPTEPRTLDAIKRRSGATFGDCQGNLCALDVARIVAAERGIPISAVEKHDLGSWLWDVAVHESTSSDRLATPGRLNDAGPSELDSGPASASWEVVVIGGGAAGQAAATAATEVGRSVLIVERDDRSMSRLNQPMPARSACLGGSTVVGLASSASGWHVLAQSSTGSTEVIAPTVIVVTGAYVMPREHRPIAGPRPAGVMTSDLAWRILGAGLRPGRTIAVVGQERAVTALTSALEEAGARVLNLPNPPDELRGASRLEAVRVANRWIEADTLVLADRLLPQAFVLRGLGLVDGRPGSRVPVSRDGRLPLPGLWAAGCCVNPTFDHDRCTDDGRRVGVRAARSETARSASA